MVSSGLKTQAREKKRKSEQRVIAAQAGKKFAKSWYAKPVDAGAVGVDLTGCPVAGRASAALADTAGMAVNREVKVRRRGCRHRQKKEVKKNEIV